MSARADKDGNGVLLGIAFAFVLSIVEGRSHDGQYDTGCGENHTGEGPRFRLLLRRRRRPRSTFCRSRERWEPNAVHDAIAYSRKR